MKIKDILSCIDAFNRSFCYTEEGNGFVRYFDPSLPDMVAHNFTLLDYKLDTKEKRKIVQKELQRQKIEFTSYLQIIDWFPLGKEEKLSSFFRNATDITYYSIFASSNLEQLQLKHRNDCVILPLKTNKMIYERIKIEKIIYSDVSDSSFYLKKGLKNGQIYLKRQGVDSYLCYYNERPIGKADYLLYNNWGMIEDFDVIPNMQRKGFGTSLIHHLQQETLTNHGDGIFFITETFGSAGDMYEKLGFQKVLNGCSLYFE